MPSNPPPLPTLSQRRREKLLTEVVTAANPQPADPIAYIAQAVYRIGSGISDRILRWSEEMARNTAPDDRFFAPGTKQQCLQHLSASELFSQQELERLENHEVLMNFDSSMTRHLKESHFHRLGLDVRRTQNAQRSIEEATKALTEGYIGPNPIWKTTTEMNMRRVLSPLAESIKKIEPAEKKDAIVEEACKKIIQEANPDIAASFPSHPERMKAFAEEMRSPQSARVGQYQQAIEQIKNLPTTFQREGEISNEECEYLKAGYAAYASFSHSLLSKGTDKSKIYTDVT